MQDARLDSDAGNHPQPNGGGWSLSALFVGLAVMVVMTVYPHAAAKPDGSPDMLTAALLFWAMSAGFVRGIGFIPHLMPLRWLLSLPAALIALGAAMRHLFTG